jgi:hypothetical protein
MHNPALPIENLDKSSYPASTVPGDVNLFGDLALGLAKSMLVEVMVAVPPVSISPVIVSAKTSSLGRVRLGMAISGVIEKRRLPSLVSLSKMV